MLIGYTIPLTGRFISSRLGPPIPDPSHETDWEWRFQLPDGCNVAVYNYQDGPSCMVPSTLGDIRVWYIGASPPPASKLAQSLILEAVQEKLGEGTCLYENALPGGPQSYNPF